MVEWAYPQVPHGPDQHNTIASDTLQHSNDAEKTTSELVYTKVKEMKLNTNLSACRLKFDLMREGSGPTIWARVYKNGVAIGEPRAASISWTTHSADFAGWVKGDLIQIYAKGANSYVPYVKNMRIYYDFVTTKTAPTNQDP